MKNSFSNFLGGSMKKNRFIFDLAIYALFIFIYIVWIINPYNGTVRYDWVLDYYIIFSVYFFYRRFYLKKNKWWIGFLHSIEASFISYIFLFILNEYTYFGVVDFFVVWGAMYFISGSVFIGFIICLSSFIFNKISHY